MGMAASQARLLTITARIHDVEYQAQSIQNAKVQLATQSDQVYNEYMAALDAQALAFTALGADGSKSLIAATFNNLFSLNSANLADGSLVGLRNEKGKLIVERDIYDAYEKFGGNDPYAFAAGVLGGEYGQRANNGYTMHQHEEAVYSTKKGQSTNLDSLRKALEEYSADGKINSGKLKPQYDNEEGRKRYQETYDNYRAELYKLYGEEICTGIKYDPESEMDLPQLMTESEYNQDKFNKLVDIFNEIKMCGGCVPITDYNGMFGDASNNNEWLTAMIQSGTFTIEKFTKDRTGKLSMSTTSPSSDSCISYTNVTSVDNTAVKKAEAKYEKDLKEIDKKDKRFDLSLSKLETERSALEKEYNSVKKVIEDNIDKTFGIFS